MSLSGVLTTAFTAAASFVIGGYIGGLIFDPIFFPVIHDITNQNAQALIGFFKDHGGDWLHEKIGLIGSGGFLNMPFFQEILQPYFPASIGQIQNTFPEGLSLDSLMNMDMM